MSPANSPQPALIITGMHRSGTSLVTSLLQSAGLDVGREMLPANHGNPKGYFENQAFLEFHRQVLTAAGLSDVGWTLEDPIARLETGSAEHSSQLSIEQLTAQARQLVQENASMTRPWGWKDPRTTLFLDFWQHHLPQARFLLLYRAPWEVIDSLYRRGDAIFFRQPTFALTAWMHYNQKLLDFYTRFPERCFLASLEAIVKDVMDFTQALSQKLAIPLTSPDASLYDQTALVRSTANPQLPILMEHYFPAAIARYEQLNSVADLPAPAQQLDAADAIAQLPDWLLQSWSSRYHLKQLHRLLQSPSAEPQAILQQINLLKARESQATARIAAMESSKFWRLRNLWFRLKGNPEG